MSKIEVGQTVQQFILTFFPVPSPLKINHRNILSDISHKILNYWFIQNIFYTVSDTKIAHNHAATIPVEM